MKNLYTFFIFIQTWWLFGQQMPIAPIVPNGLFLNNPAAAGLNADNAYHVRLLHRNQWLGVNDAPTTQIIATDKRSADGKNGIGITAFNDKSHVLSQQGLRFAYASHFSNTPPTLTPENRAKQEYQLSVGLNGGFINRRVDLSDAVLKNPNDPLLMNRTLNQIDFELGGGVDVTYRLNKSYTDEFHIGISFNHCTPFSSVDTNASAIKTAQHWIPYATYSHESTNWKVEGQFFCRFSTPQSSVQLEAASFLHWKKLIFIGASWKAKANVESQYLRYMLGLNQLRIFKNLQVMYSFEHGVPTTKSMVNAFSHDIGFHFTL